MTELVSNPIDWKDGKWVSAWGSDVMVIGSMARTGADTHTQFKTYWSPNLIYLTELNLDTGVTEEVVLPVSGKGPLSRRGGLRPPPSQSPFF
jgi:hypothetical protein